MHLSRKVTIQGQDRHLARQDCRLALSPAAHPTAMAATYIVVPTTCALPTPNGRSTGTRSFPKYDRLGEPTVKTFLADQAALHLSVSSAPVTSPSTRSGQRNPRPKHKSAWRTEFFRQVRQHLLDSNLRPVLDAAQAHFMVSGYNLQLLEDTEASVRKFFSKRPAKDRVLLVRVAHCGALGGAPAPVLRPARPSARESGGSSRPSANGGISGRKRPAGVCKTPGKRRASAPASDAAPQSTPPSA